MEASIIDQVAALPYRFDEAGRIEVLLITSRGNRHHWLPPKGNLIPGIMPHEAAAQEAFEEAGIVGTISSDPLGDYRAVKSRCGGPSRKLNVTVFPMRVEGRVADWPEKGQRSALWFERDGAARVVREDDLARMIEDFSPTSVAHQPSDEAGR